MMSPSDHWLARRLVRALGPELEASAGASALADLDYEVAMAGPAPSARAAALVVGYAALVRLFVCHGAPWRQLMRRALIVTALGLVGAGWEFEWLRVTSNGSVHLVPFAGMLVIVFLVLRAWDRDRSYLGALLNCSIVGVMMVATLLVGARAGHDSLPWLVMVGLASLSLLIVLAFSAAAAAVAWQPAPNEENAWRTSVIHAVAAASLFIPCYALNHLTFFQSSRPIRGWELMSFATVLGLLFAAVALLIHVPLMRVLRRLVPVRLSRLVLPTVGAALFPVLLFLLPALQHQLPWVLQFYASNPARLATVAIPYLVAGVAVGLLTASQPATVVAGNA